MEVNNGGDIDVRGEILARGGAGGGVIQAGTGGGGGGGSGGRISLRSGSSIRVWGVICASGGAGGYTEVERESQTGAGGGGGGGGRVRLEGEIVDLDEAAALFAEGGRGGRVWTGEAEDGSPGEAGVIEIVD